MVELNRAVAVAMAEGPERGLELLDDLEARGELDDYHLLHAARADLLRRLGRAEEAAAAYRRALATWRPTPWSGRSSSAAWPSWLAPDPHPAAHELRAVAGGVAGAEAHHAPWGAARAGGRAQCPAGAAGELHLHPHPPARAGRRRRTLQR